MNWLLNLIGGDYNQKQIDAIMPLIKKINFLYAEYDALSDEAVQSKTTEFKKRITEGESLEELLPEAFAVVKQACKRLCWTTCMVKGTELVWNMIPYDVQLIGGIILHQWKIAEMKTGEGKTLVAVAPVYLNALAGNGVHVVTVNDYLASRDSEWMGHVYQWLGLQTGSVVKSTPLSQRREEYAKDVTYVENSELGFDYLRDNLVKSIQERNLTWRPLNYAIVDEIDSILVDEARTPLIISQPKEEATEKYGYYAQVVNLLTPCSTKKKVSKGFIQEILNDEKSWEQEEDGDYYIDEKTKTAQLSGRGIAKLEEILKVENIYQDLGYQEIHHIENALKAKAVYIKDKDYIIGNGEVLIVDEHTGRTMPGRRFSEGLHQAIEAKEQVIIQRESQTMASITYQNFFKQYKKLAGMTGTASTEAEEFMKIYELEVVIIPTNKPVIRVDMNDKIYINQKAKRNFVKEYIKFYHDIWQPILIGTADIATSEYVSRVLEKDAIVHYVLNAKFHEQEANIVANAGKYRSVVVATNMAGRGTDIKLEEWLNQKLAKNYAWFIEKSLKNQTSIIAKIYSEPEFELTMEWIKEVFWLNDEEIRSMERGVQKENGISFSVKFTTKKKNNTDPFATIFVKTQGEESVIEKDFFYGLFILGTEKHESRRIDNQLRGRSGRQWDPGASVFFVALDDTLMRKMGGERMQSLAWMLLGSSWVNDLELKQKQFTNSIIRAQKEIEGWYFGIRKHLFDYDSVTDKQRKRIYKVRDQILESEWDEKKQEKYVNTMKKDFLEGAKNIISSQVDGAEATGQPQKDLLFVLSKEFGLAITQEQHQELSQLNYADLKAVLLDRLERYFSEVFEKVDTVILFNLFREVHLHFIDTLWVNHIDEMQNLRDKVWLMAYAQLDPLVMYKKESFDKFQELLQSIQYDTSKYLMKIDFHQLMEQQFGAPIINLETKKTDQNEVINLLAAASKDFGKQRSTTVAKQDGREKIFEKSQDFEVFEVDDAWDNVITKENPSSEVESLRAQKKVRPNDPCSCGSGKKYKKCCGAK